VSFLARVFVDGMDSKRQIGNMAKKKHKENNSLCFLKEDN
jgi:hypothetical protein